MSGIYAVVYYVCVHMYHSHRVSIKSDRNEEVVRKLVKEVKGLNPSFDGADIRGMFGFYSVQNGPLLINGSILYIFLYTKCRQK